MLVGMMGSGKTSVGRLLARRLGWEFIDTDELVEAEGAQAIAEIFAREGEARFRARERKVLEALPRQNAVIALGGGAPVCASNRALLRSKGTLVWLDAQPEALAARVGPAAGRPLLAGLDGRGRLERIRALRAEREAAYAECDLRVPTDDCTPQQVCNAVLSALGWEDAA